MFGALHRNWKTAIYQVGYESAADKAAVKNVARMSDRYNIFGIMADDSNIR